MLPDFDDFDSYTDFCTAPLDADSTPPAFSFSSAQHFQQISPSLGNSVDSGGQSDAHLKKGCDSSTSFTSDELMDMSTATVPSQIHRSTLQERMLRALALLKELSGEGPILAQVWMPVRSGEHRVLTTSDQPFLLDERLTGYREISRQFTFAATQRPSLFPGLPGRVFLSGMLEWTSNVMYYNSTEYLRVDHAMRHEVRGSLALPLFDRCSTSCCAVLELVMTKEKDNFCSEIDDICNAFQSVDLSTVKARTSPQRLCRNKESAFMEILNVLRTACHAHMLPLALAWVPACSSSNATASVEYGQQATNFASSKKYFLCIHESACYVNDIRMHDFVRACSEHPLEEGQGIAGNAILSNNPFFSSDVREYDMRDYPLAHHVRKFGLQAAVAIRLRSTLTGNDDYVLEFFLPLLCNGGEEQQLLLDGISVTMQRACRSLRTVSDAELIEDAQKMPLQDKGLEIRCPSSDISVSSGVKYNSPSDIRTNTRPGNHLGSTNEQPGDKTRANKLKPSKAPCGEKRLVSSEKNVSLSVLQKYFAGSLKDAAKSIGVCPTTLKRICRQQGIMRWPSRKIKKVNRSLRKIQNVISSVQGVNRELKYDPATGFLISSASPSRKPSQMSAELDGTDSLLTEPDLSELKVEPDCDAYLFCLNDGLRGKSDTVHRGNVSCLTKEPTSSLETNVWIAGVHQKGASRDPLSMPQQCNTDNKNIEQSLPSSSSMTNSSRGSGLSHGTFKKCIKPKKDNKSDMAIIVKAFYKDDTLRFRLLPTMNYQQLLLEVAERLKLSVGTFQLNYRDDEDEWVILASDADLQECRDMIDTTRLHILKVQVRDVPYVAGSSSGCTSISGM